MSLLEKIDKNWSGGKGFKPLVYRKASGKPLALAMGMNTVVALATLKKLIVKSLSAIFCDKVKS